MSRFTIVYSSSIAVFDGESRVGNFPFGAIHTSAFLKYKKQLKAIGGVKEVTSFYPIKHVFDEKPKLAISPRQYQQAVVDIATMDGVFNGLFEAPTGSGKTNMIAYLVAELNKTAIVIVPTADLIHQTYRRFLSVFGITEEQNSNQEIVGMLGDGNKQFNRPVLITTWHSLMNDASRKKVLEYGYNILICDETHRASANLLSQYIGMFKSMKKFGFSASVYRSRAEQMEKIHNLLGPKVHSVDINDLYREGFVLKPEISRIEIPFNASIESATRYHYEQMLRTKKKMRHAISNILFNKQQYKMFRPKNKSQYDMVNLPTEEDIALLTTISVLSKDEAQKEAEANDRKTMTEDEFAEAKKKRSSISLGLAKKGIDGYSKRQEIVFNEIASRLNPPGSTERAAILTNSISAGEAIAEGLKNIGYTNILIVNGSGNDKKQTVEALSSGTIDDFIVVSTVQFLSEGTDIPKLQKVFVASPVYNPYTSAERLQQIVGRVVRPDATNPSKVPEAFVFDDAYTDGFAASKKEAMWEYCLSAFKVEAKRIEHDQSAKLLVASAAYGEALKNSTNKVI